MTGEMSWIKPNGEDSNGNSYPIHASVAKALRCNLRPFDVYCGPYIDHKAGRIWLSTEDGYVGQAVLWIGGTPPACKKPVLVEYVPFDDPGAALIAARRAIKERGRP